MKYQDIKLKCQICKIEFNFTAEEQKHFDGMVIQGKWKVANPPMRCPACRCRKIPMRADAYINDEAIVEFVEAVESKKGFKRRADLVLRHILEELAECSAALWKHEEEVENSIHAIPPPAKVARELVDIIFLSVWMADILGIDLNEATAWRMKEVAKQYNVEDREAFSK